MTAKGGHKTSQDYHHDDTGEFQPPIVFDVAPYFFPQGQGRRKVVCVREWWMKAKFHQCGPCVRRGGVGVVIIVCSVTQTEKRRNAMDLKTTHYFLSLSDTHGSEAYISCIPGILGNVANDSAVF